MEELISVIIPAYNAQTYLRQTLESVSAQSYQHFEVIVVDDGSTDGTAEIVRNAIAGDARIRLISKENGGLGDARNSGIDAAKGEWVTFLDSDDRLLPNALSLLLSAAVRSGCEIEVGGMVRRYVATDSDFGDEVRHFTLSPDKAIELTLYQRSGLEPSACGKLYRRRLFDNLRFAKGVWYEDLDFFYRAYLQAGDVAVIDIPVYYYRSNPDGFLGSFKRERLDVLKVTEQMEKYMSAKMPKLLPAARDRRLSANFNMLGLLSLQPITAETISVMSGCEDVIKSYRSASLLNPNVRIKNKLGAMASYCGMPILRALLRRQYKVSRRVVTLTREELRDTCMALGYKVIDSGFKPDAIVVIKTGGVYVAEEIAKLFPGTGLFEVEMRRPATNGKRRLRALLRYLPLTLLDALRIGESRLMRIRRRKVNTEVRVPEGLSGNILVIDDAVDSGVTLLSVVESLKKSNPGAAIRSAAITVTAKWRVITPDYYIYDNMTLMRFPWSADWKE